MKRQMKLWLMVLTILLLPVVVSAQEDGAEETKVVMEITVGKVVGDVQYRASAEEPWSPLEEGAVLSPDAEVSTGLFQSVLLMFSDNSEVLIRQTTEIRVAEAHRTETTNVTRLELRYGSMGASVHKGTLANDFEVTTPTSTTAVKGTKIHEIGYDKAYGSYIEMGEEGTVQWTNDKKESRSVTARERSDDKNTSPIVAAKRLAVTRMQVQGETTEEVKTAMENDRVVSSFELLRNSTPSNTHRFWQARRKITDRPYARGVVPNTDSEVKPW